jgi:hypothetical protein
MVDGADIGMTLAPQVRSVLAVPVKKLDCCMLEKISSLVGRDGQWSDPTGVAR